MKIHTITKRLPVAGALLIGTLLMAGCGGTKSTSGFKAEEKPSRAQIEQQIAQVKANNKMPANVKSMALKKLEEDLAKAK